jgi:hypothetical protein
VGGIANLACKLCKFAWPNRPNLVLTKQLEQSLGRFGGQAGGEFRNQNQLGLAAIFRAVPRNQIAFDR